MKGYDVVVRFFVQGADEHDACAVVESAIYRNLTGGFGYEVVEAFESVENE